MWCTSHGPIELLHLPVLTHSLGHTEPPKALYPSKAVEAAVFDPSEGQGLAHVGAAEIIDARHASLRNKSATSFGMHTGGTALTATSA